MKKKVLNFFLLVIFLALLAVVTISADAVFNDGLFFKNAVASSLFSVKNAEDEYMSINLDRTRYLESIVITNAYYLQKGAEEYAYMNDGCYTSYHAYVTLPEGVINPFTGQVGSWFCYIDDNPFPPEGFVSYCKAGISPESYTIVGAGKDGRIILTLHNKTVLD